MEEGRKREFMMNSSFIFVIGNTSAQDIVNPDENPSVGFFFLNKACVITRIFIHNDILNSSTNLLKI